MSNIVQNHLYIKGAATLVDEITSGSPFHKPVPEIEILSEDREAKTVRFSFESTSDAPWPWFKATVDKYHEAGVRFFLFWYDADNIQCNPIAPDAELVYGRFGEIYTELIPHPDGEQPQRTTVFTSPEMGWRHTDGAISSVFNKSVNLGDSVNEFLTDRGIVSIPRPTVD